MAFLSRWVVGYVFDAGGTPVLNGQVKAQLDQDLAFSDTHIIAQREFFVVTDSITEANADPVLAKAPGKFRIKLWCDESGLAPVDYKLFFPNTDGGGANKELSYELSVAYEDGTPKNIGTAIIEGLDPEEIADSMTLQNVIDGRIAAAAVVRYASAQTLTDEQKAQARANIGLAAVAASGSYNDLSGKPNLSVYAPLGGAAFTGAVSVTSTNGVALKVRVPNGHDALCLDVANATGAKFLKFTANNYTEYYGGVAQTGYGFAFEGDYNIVFRPRTSGGTSGGVHFGNNPVNYAPPYFVTVESLIGSQKGLFIKGQAEQLCLAYADSIKSSIETDSAGDTVFSNTGGDFRFDGIVWLKDGTLKPVKIDAAVGGKKFLYLEA